MRPVPAEGLAALVGSRRDKVTVHSWLAGEVIAQDLPVSEWAIGWDATRQVQAQMSLTISDKDGDLAPWALDDPLGVGGPRLQVIYSIGGTSATVDLGWFRITRADPAESWRVYTSDDPDSPLFGRVEWVSGGASIPVEADDLTKLIVRDKLLAPSSPTPGATVLSEVRRLLSGIVPVTVAPGVVDAPVTGSVVYERERLDAVEDLLARISTTHRMTGDGQFEVVPSGPQDPVWTVAGGREGALVQVQRSQNIDDLYNAVVSEGTDANTSLPVSAVALEVSGPLRWDGPHGHQPMFQSSPLIDSQAEAQTDAQTTLAGRVADRTVDLPVTCLPHPGLQPWDWVQIAVPVAGDAPALLVGQVVAMNLRGSTAGVSPMTLQLRCKFEDVQVVAARVRALRRG